MAWKAEPYEFTINRSSEAPFNRLWLSIKMTSYKKKEFEIKENNVTKIQRFVNR